MPEPTPKQVEDAPSGRLVDVLEWQQSTKVGADITTPVWSVDDGLAPIRLDVNTYWDQPGPNPLWRAVAWLEPDEAIALAERLLGAVSAVTANRADDMERAARSTSDH